jgi:hypothetical protein
MCLRNVIGVRQQVIYLCAVWVGKNISNKKYNATYADYLVYVLLILPFIYLWFINDAFSRSDCSV